MNEILSITDIRAGYGALDVIFNINMNIKPGEIVAVIGPNGAGKSTLLKVISGVLRSNKGKVTYKSKDITNKSPQEIVKMGLSWVPQENNIFSKMTVRENLEIGAFILDENIDERLDEVFLIFPQLKDRMDQIAGSLSGGQRQMLAIARGLMIHPELLLLDEPTAGLAPNLAHDMLIKIKNITEKFGNAVLLVTQTLNALELSERVYLLTAGEIKYEDTTDNFLNNQEIKELYFGGVKHK
ncbi:MAG: ABC transporter ATP-binding protein [Spirochaetes bacterium]|nr:MAG: ABC transporter ATP-binding protein [Spirochaetota bacterium]